MNKQHKTPGSNKNAAAQRGRSAHQKKAAADKPAASSPAVPGKKAVSPKAENPEEQSILAEGATPDISEKIVAALAEEAEQKANAAKALAAKAKEKAADMQSDDPADKAAESDAADAEPDTDTIEKTAADEKDDSADDTVEDSAAEKDDLADDTVEDPAAEKDEPTDDTVEDSAAAEKDEPTDDTVEDSAAAEKDEPTDDTVDNSAADTNQSASDEENAETEASAKASAADTLEKDTSSKAAAQTKAPSEKAEKTLGKGKAVSAEASSGKTATKKDTARNSATSKAAAAAATAKKNTAASSKKNGANKNNAESNRSKKKSNAKKPENSGKPTSAKDEEPKKNDAAKQDAKKTEKPKKIKRPNKVLRKLYAHRKKILIAVASVFLVAGLVLFGYTYQASGVLQGVSAGDIKLAGMSQTEASAAIEATGTNYLRQKSLRLIVDGETYDLKLSSVSSGLNSEKTAQLAYDYGRKGGPFTRAGQALRALVASYVIPLSLDVNEQNLKQTLQTIAGNAITEPVDPSYEVDNDNLILHTGSRGVTFDMDTVSEDITNKIQHMDLTDYTVNIHETAQESLDFDAIKAAVDRTAKNATVNVKDGATISPAVDGLSLDINKAKQIVGDGSAESYTIPLKVTKATVSASDLAKQLFHDPLVSTSTALDNTDVSRVNNIRLASQALDNTIINSGDTFSFNDTIGECTAQRGYQKSGLYQDGQYVKDYSGGVSQVSSTLYMALLRTDLNVTDRTCHDYIVSFAPLGEDAMFLPGSVDLKFVNSSAYPIKIESEIKDGQVHISLTGTKTTETSITVKNEILESIQPETITRTDDTLAAGTTRVSQTQSTGYKTVTYQLVTTDGKTETVKANESNYNTRDQIVLVGPSTSSNTIAGKSSAPGSSASTNTTGGGTGTQTTGSATTSSGTGTQTTGGATTNGGTGTQATDAATTGGSTGTQTTGDAGTAKTAAGN